MRTSKEQHWLLILILFCCPVVGSCNADSSESSVRLQQSPQPLATVREPQASATQTTDLKVDPVAKELRSALLQVNRKTKVPVLLPSKLPLKVDKEPLYAHSESEVDSYGITLGTEPDCGVNACLVGIFQATRSSEAPHADEVDKLVNLAAGIKGYYTAKSCGASCAPPQIQWMYRRALYTIQFKVDGKDAQEDEANIVEMANSAISSGPR
jgi:hypothetical protein